MQRVLLSLLLISVFSYSHAQIDYTQKDLDIFNQSLSEFQEKDSLPINELAISIAKHFLGTPYVAGTLEKNDKEQLIVNLREFDCTTFVESVVALANEIKKGKEHSFTEYANLLKSMRYRKGVIDGYVSRIHYTSEWVGQNTSFFENITSQLGGKMIHKHLSFMTSNSHLYPHLKGNQKNIAKLREVEVSLDHAHYYVLLDKSNIEEAAKDIKDGDIIIFGTKVSGLDYSHIGFALWEGDTLKLLHASSGEKKVVIDKKSLVEYCESSRPCTGITVLRLK